MTATHRPPERLPILGLHHSAYRCRDAEETRHFYEDVLGFPLSTTLHMDRNPATGLVVEYCHIFFDIGSHSKDESNYIAFFEVLDWPGDDPDELFKTRWGLDLHFAMGVPDHAALLAWRDRLARAGIEVEGPIDHEIFTSIYFHDPNGYRLEFSAQNAAEKARFDEEKKHAHRGMQEWLAYKAGRSARKAAVG